MVTGIAVGVSMEHLDDKQLEGFENMRDGSIAVVVE